MYTILDFSAFGCESMEDGWGQSVFTGLGFEQSNTKTIDTSSEISHSSAIKSGQNKKGQNIF